LLRHQVPSSRASLLALHESPSSSSNGKSKTANPPPAEFEYQEMKIQLNALARAGITSPKGVNPINRNEIVAYAKQVVAKSRPSLVDPSQLSSFLPSTKWRLALSTDDAVLQGLPGGANVYLGFVDDVTMEYVLEFGPQTLGLDKIAAHSRYSVDSANGIVTYTYESITCDVGPFKQVGVGLFGMLQGRSSSVRASYVDGKVWIERDIGSTGDDVFNVYVREDTG
jgi:hypothetical protein